MIDILIVDDCRTVQHMLQLVLGHADDMRVVNVADTAVQALEMAEKQKPAIVTLDLNLPDMDGLEFLDLLLQKPDDRHVIVLTGSEGVEQSALAHGAFACFEKGTLMARMEQFLQTIRDAAASPQTSGTFTSSGKVLPRNPRLNAH